MVELAMAFTQLLKNIPSSYDSNVDFHHNLISPSTGLTRSTNYLTDKLSLNFYSMNLKARILTFDVIIHNEMMHS